MLSRLWAELANRRVLRTAGVYLGTTLLVLRLAERLGPMFGAGDQFQQLLSLALTMGFPVAVVLAWRYGRAVSAPVDDGNASPGSVEVEDEQGETKFPLTRARLIDLAVIGVVLAVGFLYAERFFSTEPPPGALVGDPSGPIRAIAVLPLDNLSGDSAQEYVADGMTDELIGALAKLGSLSVISRTSVMRYKQRTQSIPEIAAELGVNGVMEGSVAREENRFRINLLLIDARTDTQLWANQFDREQSSVLALRSEVARAVAEQVQLELTPEEDTALTSSRQVDPLAFDEYLRGRALRGATPGSPASRAQDPQGLEHFERAVALDPGFAEAWVQVALSRYRLGQYEQSEEAVRRALQLDPNLGSAHSALAVLRRYHWDFSGERLAAERAIELSPNSPGTLNTFSWSLVRHGRLAEALRVSERIPMVAPLDPFRRTGHLISVYYTRHNEQTLQEAERVRAVTPGFRAIEEELANRKLDRLRDAHLAVVAAYEWCGTPTCELRRKAAERGWAEGGPAGALRALLEAFEGTTSYFTIGSIHATLGEKDEAFAWLDRGYDEHDPAMALVSVAPYLDPIRSDPRFDELLHRMAFPEHKSPVMLADVGYTLALAGRAEEAIAGLEEVLQLAPEEEHRPRWRYYMAMAHFAAGRYEQAALWAQRALEDEAGNQSLAFSHLLLSSANAYLDRPDEARESLAAAKRLWPDVAIKWDLSSIFMAGDPALRDRYLDGLRKAGMEA